MDSTTDNSNEPTPEAQPDEPTPDAQPETTDAPQEANPTQVDAPAPADPTDPPSDVANDGDTSTEDDQPNE